MDNTFQGEVIKNKNEKSLKESRGVFLRRLYLHILDITEFVCGELKRRKMGRKKLAKRMRVFESHLDTLLNDLPEDFRIADLLRLADALNMDIDLRHVFVPRKQNIMANILP